MWAAARPCAGKGGGPRRPRSLCHRGRPRPARRPPHPAWLPPRALAQRCALPPRVGRGQLGLAACDWLGRPPVTPRGSLPLTDGERPPPPPGCVRAVRGGAPPLAGAAVSQRDAPPLPAGAGPLPARPCGEHLRPLAGRAVRQQRLRPGSAAPLCARGTMGLVSGVRRALLGLTPGMLRVCSALLVVTAQCLTASQALARAGSAPGGAAPSAGCVSPGLTAGCGGADGRHC